MENIVDSYMCEECYFIIDWIFLASISKGPQNIGANLLHLPKLNEFHLDSTFK